MSDARRIDITTLLTEPTEQFTNALAISRQSATEDVTQLILDNALMDTLQNGHNWAEAALRSSPV